MRLRTALITIKALEQMERFKGLFWFNGNWAPSGMLTSGKSGSGDLGWFSDNLTLYTGGTSGSYAYAYKLGYGLVLAPVWNKKRLFGVNITFSHWSDQYAHVVTGGVTNPNASANTRKHVGFKLINNGLYGTVGNGTNESVLLLETLTKVSQRILECVLTPNVECRFYVNRVDKGAITTNLPSGSDWAEQMLYLSIYNTVALNRELYILESRTYQEA